MFYGNGNVMGGDLEILAWLIMGFIALAVGAPLTILFIRFLNQTWLDPDWRRNEGLGQGEVSFSPEPPSPESQGAVPAGTAQGIRTLEPKWGMRPK
jgi:hypothetical protein